MRIEPGSKRARLADLYWLSGSVKFGSFRLAAHLTNPDLEESPHYLHFPKEADDSGQQYMPELAALAAELFLELANSLGLKFNCFAAVPSGAEPVAAELFELCGENIVRLIFAKETRDGDNYFIGPVEGNFQEGWALLVIEDHTSGGHNKKLFIEAAARAGLVVFDVLTIVDRMQGAARFLQSIGVGFHAIFTIDELLEYYLGQGLIDQEMIDRVRGYISRNQIDETA